MPRSSDFSTDIKELLAKRVGTQCSNPNCRQPTSGPQKKSDGVLNIGVAAHITAASHGGPRYDQNITASERKSPDNGIWLCQNCAKLIDNDVDCYTVDILRKWKAMSEEAARLEIVSPHKIRHEQSSDAELIRFFAQCFDRPAFQDHFHQEGSMEAFDKAIEDTITALNTGALRSRDGMVLQTGKGKAYLNNAQWRRQMDVIVDLLRAIRARYELGRKLGTIHVGQTSNDKEFYCINDRSIAEWMDSTRAQITQIFSEVASEAGVQAPRFPRPRSRAW